MSKSGGKKYVVGRGKPPPQHQWKKGCPSPNPKGRPRKRQPHTIAEAIDDILSEKVPMNRNGRTSHRPILEAILRKLVMGIADSDRDSFTILNGMRKWGSLTKDSVDPVEEFLKTFGIAITLDLDENDPTPTASLFRLDDPNAEGIPFNPFGGPVEPDEPQ
jgi:hypothetical protein